MELFGLDIIYLIGAIVVATAILLSVAIILGVSTVILWKRNKIFIPDITLLIVSAFELPINRVMSFFKMEESDSIDKMITSLRNMKNEQAFSKTPYNKRALFVPQCLRSPNCPARLSAEGLICINCGQCGLGLLKKEAEGMGYMFFISPGSSLIKRMVKKYRPSAVIGIGCPVEVKEGTAMMERRGIPVQAVSLSRDGCVDTRVDISDLLACMRLGDFSKKDDPELQKKIEEISKRWKEAQQISDNAKKAARAQYLDAEKEELKII